MTTLCKTLLLWFSLGNAGARAWVEPEWHECPAARGLDL